MEMFPSSDFMWGIKNINHTQIVNDTFLMGHVLRIIASCFNFILQIFVNAYGGLVNYEKIHI